MKGSGLRIRHGNVLRAALMTAALLIVPFPANTSVYSPQPFLQSPQPILQRAPSDSGVASGTAEQALHTPAEAPLGSELRPLLVSAPAFLGAGPRRAPPADAPQTSPAPRPPAPEVRREPLLPNLFGTVARATSRAPNGWDEHVAASADAFDTCLAQGSACGEMGAWREATGSLASLPLRQRLAQANVFVNNAIGFRSDMAATGQRDSWISPAQLFRTRIGDCEDFALAKYWLLRAAGVPEEDMYLMVVNDLVARAAHAYLAVRVGDDFVLLDSRTNQVLSPDRVDDIVPLVTIGVSGAYLHGRPA